MPKLIPIDEMDINDLRAEVHNLRVALLTEGHTEDCAIVNAASADCSCEYAEQHLSLEAVRSLVRDIRQYAIRNGLLIGECVPWNLLKKLVLPKEEL